MLLWLLLLAGLGLTIGAVALVIAMSRAERRARRTLYRSLGFNEETVDLLMARNRDVPSELALVRLNAVTTTDAADVAVHGGAADDEEGRLQRQHPALRLVTPVNGATTVKGEARLSAAARRRLPHPGRHNL